MRMADWELGKAERIIGYELFVKGILSQVVFNKWTLWYNDLDILSCV